VSRTRCGRGWLVLGLVVVMAWCAPAAVARSGAPLAFGAPVRVDTGAIVSLSCPSTTLCVGVDSGGRLVSSTRPTDRHVAWKTATVAGAAGAVDLLEVSCPSTGECIGIDRSGDIVSSTDLGSPAPNWTVANVVDVNGPPYPTADLQSIDCPTISLCVVGDATGDVITSADPTAGTGAWAISHVDQGTTYECEHYGDMGPGCVPSFEAVSCASATSCQALDVLGNLLGSHDPAGGPDAWVPNGGSYIQPSDEHSWGYLACTQLFCLAAPLSGRGIYATAAFGKPANDLDRVAELGGEPTSLSCPSVSLCLAGSGTVAKVYASSDPEAPGSWRPVDANVGASSDDGFSAIACASARLCFAGGDRGTIAVGTPSPTTGQLRAQLRSLATEPLRHANAAELLRRDGYKEAITPPVTGRLTLTCRSTGQAGTHTHDRGRLVADGSTSLIKGRQGNITIKLTGFGRRLLEHAKSPVRLTIKIRLVPRFQPAVSISATTTLPVS
jgi:hypothetical protein